jgi:hypothetical protein
VAVTPTFELHVRPPGLCLSPTQSQAAASGVLERRLFNFGYYQIVRRNGKMHFIADVRDEHGGQRLGSEVDLTPK